MRLYNQTSCIPLGARATAVSSQQATITNKSVPKSTILRQDSFRKANCRESARELVPPSQTNRVRFYMANENKRHPLDDERIATDRYNEKTAGSSPVTPCQPKAPRTPKYGIARAFPTSPKELGIGSRTLLYSSSQLSPPPKQVQLESRTEESFRIFEKTSRQDCELAQTSQFRLKKKGPHETKKDKLPLLIAGLSEDIALNPSSSIITELSSCSSGSNSCRCLTSGPIDSLDDSGWFEFSCLGSKNHFIQPTEGSRTPTQSLNRGIGFDAGDQRNRSTMRVKSRKPKSLPKPGNRSSGLRSKLEVSPRCGVEPLVNDYGPVDKKQVRGSHQATSNTKALSPPPRDVKPIFPDKREKASGHRKDLSKYTIMLKSGFAFSCVQRTMERDGVDPSIIDLVVCVSSRS